MFNIPGASSGGDSGPFLARVQYDARSGFFTNVNREQGADGAWKDHAGEPYRGPTFAVDFGSLEAGYIKFASPPSFLLVPYLGDDTVYPRQPEEMAQAKPGEKPRKAFLPGFRVKVMSKKTFGDSEPRYFAHTAKGVMGAMFDLYSAFASAPEARTGQIPLVAATGTKTLETSGPRGTTKNYAPVFTITGWVDRPAGFGERTVPPPSGPAPAASAAPAPKAAPAPEIAERQAQAARELENSDLPF